MQNGSEQHRMELIETHPSGAEEWQCPDCGRHLLVQWPPNFKTVVLAEGNKAVMHGGSKGEVEVGQPTVEQAEEPAGQPVEEPILSEMMRAALEELDFSDFPAND